MNISTLFDQISALSKSCHPHIRQLRCICPYLDLKTASNIATSIVHWASLYAWLLQLPLLQSPNPKSHINHLQLIHNSLARSVVKAPKSCHISQPPRCTRTSSVVTLAHPQASSSLKITNRSFWHSSPHLWNKLPVSLRQLCTFLRAAVSVQIGPCCPALCCVYTCLCCCVFIEQIKWWWTLS